MAAAVAVAGARLVDFVVVNLRSLALRQVLDERVQVDSARSAGLRGRRRSEPSSIQEDCYVPCRCHAVSHQTVQQSFEFQKLASDSRGVYTFCRRGRSRSADHPTEL